MNVFERKQKLRAAVEQGEVLRVEALLKAGGNVNSIYSDGKTLLITAAERQNRQIVEYLLKKGANPNQRDFLDYTPLMYATKRSALVVQLLIDAGAEVNARNIQGRTALMYAAIHASMERVKILLDAGAEINTIDHKNCTALDYASYRTNNEVQAFLIAQGAQRGELKETAQGKGFIETILSMDEFKELRHSKRAPTQIGWFSTWNDNPLYFMYFYLALALMYIGPCGPLNSVFLLIVVWVLLRDYPSILKIFPLVRDMMRNNSQSLNVTVPTSRPSIHDLQFQDDMEFIGYLIAFGSKELEAIHTHPPHLQRRAVQTSILFSRLLSVLLAASVLGMAFFAFWGDWVIAIFLPIWGWIATRLERKLRIWRLQMVQRERDRMATEIAELLDAKQYQNRDLPPTFGLYLRAFMTTDKLYIKGFDLETILAYSLAPSLPLLALGKPGEHLGSGRIQTTDEHWQEEILRLMDAARLILIIPSYRPGTLWEISTLLKLGYFEKTIFIMPPGMEFLGGRYSDDWNKTVKAALQDGIEFPDHVHSGLLFRLNIDGEIQDWHPFLGEEFMQEDTYVTYAGEVEAAVSEADHLADTIHDVDGGSDHDYDAGTYVY